MLLLLSLQQRRAPRREVVRTVQSLRDAAGYEALNTRRQQQRHEARIGRRKFQQCTEQEGVRIASGTYGSSSDSTGTAS